MWEKVGVGSAGSGRLLRGPGPALEASVTVQGAAVSGGTGVREGPSLPGAQCPPAADTLASHTALHRHQRTLSFRGHSGKVTLRRPLCPLPKEPETTCSF